MASSSSTDMSQIIPTNNFVASLTMESKYPVFHTLQKFLAASEVKHALTVCSDGISRAAVTAIYDSGEVDLVAHRIKFAYEGETKTITLETVREALQLPVLDNYDEPASLDTLKHWFEQIGCTENLEGKQGRLKKSTLRAEWSFFFDTISRVFSPKRTNFDVFPVYVQQMGYALLYNQKYNFAEYLLERIGECIHTDRKSIYYGRFLTAIFKYLFPNFVVAKPDNVEVPQVSARILLELFKQNCNKKLSDVVYPEHVLSLTRTGTEALSGSQPLSIPSSQPLQTAIPSGSSQKLPA